MGHGKNATKQRALTDWRPQREGIVRTQKETSRATGTHFLEIAEGGTCQDMERKRLSNGHSQTGDHRGRNLSGHRNKATKQRVPTSWRPQMEGLVRTRKETDRVTGTHFLETTEGGTCQDTEKATERQALTLWRPQMEGLVRTRKEGDRERGTHCLETAEGVTY